MSPRRRLGGIAAVLLLWLAVLTIAFHGYGGARQRTLHHTASFHLPTRKMLLAMASFDASSPSTTTAADDRHHHHHSHHSHHHQPHNHHDRWNRQGVPPAAGPGEEVDPRFGVQKRLVPTGPNPLHH